MEFSIKDRSITKEIKQCHFSMNITDLSVDCQSTTLLNLIFWTDSPWPVPTTGPSNYGTKTVKNPWGHSKPLKITSMTSVGIQPTQVSSQQSTMTVILTCTIWPEMLNCQSFRKKSADMDWTSADGTTMGQQLWLEIALERWICTFWPKNIAKWMGRSMKISLNTSIKCLKEMSDYH